MASKFTITAELNLQTKNLNQVIGNLRQQFQGANLNIKLKDLAQAQSHIENISKSTNSAKKSFDSLGSSVVAAAKRFSGMALATGTLIGLTRAIKNAVGEAVEFEREVVKISQATGKTVSDLRSLANEVGNVASQFGVSSKELILAARELTQAGFAADKVRGTLKLLAQTELAATFDSIADTTEGVIAVLNQFGREAQRTGNEIDFLERSLSAINQVSKDFAVESSDLITAIRTTGSAFQSAGGDLNELIALFTSVRATTRESAESIATGFRTIFTRVQRVDTINALRNLGVELQDAEGKFVGPMEAAKKLAIALQTIDPRDFRFNLVVEELGGFRQVSKVIPLIQQFAVAQKALGVAQQSSGSLAKDAATAQQSLGVQIEKTREEFKRFIRDLTGSSSFQDTARFLLQLANSFIKVADTIKPLIPLIASFGALQLGRAFVPGIRGLAGIGKKAQGGAIHRFASGGLVPGQGNGDTVPAQLTPGEFVIRKSSVQKLGADNLARMNKYAEGGPISRIGGAATANKFQKGRIGIGIGEDQFYMSNDVSQEKLTIDYNDKNKKFQVKPGEGARGARVKNISKKDVEVLLKNNTESATMWEDIVAKSYGGTANHAAGFPADIEFNSLRKIKDAKYKPFKSDDSHAGIKKVLNYLLFKQFGNKGYKYSGSAGTVQYDRKEKNPTFLGQSLRTGISDKFIWNGQFGFVYPDYGANFNDGLATNEDSITHNLGKTRISNKKDLNRAIGYASKKQKAFGGVIEKLALGGPAGKSRGARAITIPRTGTYTFNKPAGADLDTLSANKQQYKLNAEDRLDYDVDHVNVDVNKLKVSKELLEKYQAADAQKRGYRFEDILKETGMAKSLSEVKNARLDGITASGDPFEAKSRISAISSGELEDKIYGAIADSISSPEKLARSRFNANALTEGEDHAKIGKITVFEDITGGLGAAKNTKSRMGYAEEEAAKQFKEQGKQASLNAQERLKGLVDKHFASGYKIAGTQYSPIGDKGMHRDLAAALNKKLGGSYQDRIGSMSDAQVVSALGSVLVKVRKEAKGGSIAGLTEIPWMAKGGETDTVPAMLTPGEYVINKKSAQKIGYSTLNRMNKVGKFAKGGPVQYFTNGGTPTGQFSAFAKHAPKDPNFVSSDSLAQSAKNLKPQVAETQKLSDKLKSAADASENSANKFLILAGITESVVAQFSNLSDEQKAYYSALGASFSVYKGIGNSLKDFGLDLLTAAAKRKEEKLALQQSAAAATNHAAAVNQAAAQVKGSSVETKSTKGFSKLSAGLIGLDVAMTGFSAVMALASANAAYFAQVAEKSGKRLDETLEMLSKDASKVSLGRLTSDISQASSDKYKADAMGKIGSGSTSIIKMIGAGLGGAAVGAAGGAAATANPLGMAIGGGVGFGAGAYGEYQRQKAEAERKAAQVLEELNQASLSLATSFKTSAEGVQKLQKFMSDVDKKSDKEVTAQAQSSLEEYTKALDSAVNSELRYMNATGSLVQAQKLFGEEIKKAKEKADEFAKTLDQIIGAEYARQINQLGQKVGTKDFDIQGAINKIVDSQKEMIAKRQATEAQGTYGAKIEDLKRGAGQKGEKAEFAKFAGKQIEDKVFGPMGIAAQKGAKQMYEIEKASLEASIQLIKQKQALEEERAIREKLIGTLTTQLALSAGLENFEYSIKKANDAIGNAGAIFSNSMTQFTSNIPSADVLSLSMPNESNMGDFKKAMDVISSIGPTGKKLADNFSQLNSVMPKLEVGLKKGNLSVGADKKQVESFVSSLGIDAGSEVGQAITKAIEKETGSKEKATRSGITSPEEIAKKVKDNIDQYAKILQEGGGRILKAMQEHEASIAKAYDQIGESRKRQLDLELDSADGFQELVKNVSSAQGKILTLNEKNLLRTRRQNLLAGKLAGSPVAISKRLEEIRKNLSKETDMGKKAGLNEEAVRLKQALKELSNQSTKTADTLSELERLKQQRETARDATKNYLFGTQEERQKTDETLQATQMAMMTGDIDSIPDELKSSVSSLLEQFKDIPAFNGMTGKQVQNQLMANKMAQMGNFQGAQMVLNETSSPEQQLLKGLGNIYAQEEQSRMGMLKEELAYQAMLNESINQNTKSINNLGKDIEQRRTELTPVGGKENIESPEKLEAQKKSMEGRLANVNAEIAKLDKTISETLQSIDTLFRQVKDKIENRVAKKAKGGLIYLAGGGFTPQGTDTVPAMLTPGEYVIRKSAVDSVGVDTLDAINNGYASGGLVDYLRRGGRPRNYGRSANAKRQRAIANAEKRRQKKADAEAQAASDLAVSEWEQQGPQTELYAQQMTDQMTRNTQFFGGQVTQEDYGSRYNLEPETPAIPSIDNSPAAKSKRLYNATQENMKKAAIAAAKKDLEAQPVPKKSLFDRLNWNYSEKQAKARHREQVLKNYQLTEDDLKLASGGLVSYFARGGYAGRAARARERAEQRRSQGASAGTRTSPSGMALTRETINNPQTSGEASYARTRKASLRGTSNSLATMAAAGQTIEIKTEADRIRDEYAYQRQTGNNPYKLDPDELRMKKDADVKAANRKDAERWNQVRSANEQRNKQESKIYKSPGKGYTWNSSTKTWMAPEKNAEQMLSKYPTREQLAAKKRAEEDSLFSRKPSTNEASRYTDRKYQKSNAPLTAVEKIMQQAKPGWRSANYSKGGAVYLAGGGHVGGGVRRYQDGGSVQGEGSGVDMSGFAQSVESLNAIASTFSSFTETLSNLASQFAGITVQHTLTVDGSLAITGVDGAAIASQLSEAIKQQISNMVKEQIGANNRQEKR